jgi:hypothetical protein
VHLGVFKLERVPEHFQIVLTSRIVSFSGIQRGAWGSYLIIPVTKEIGRTVTQG